MRVVFLLLIILFISYPFPFTIAQVSYSINDLSIEQKENIQIASNTINNFVLKPKQVFSLNNILGERNEIKNYKKANSYLINSPNSATLGGGICLLAGALYSIALQNNFKILERKSHIKILHSIPAGFDATIWFPEIDLKFQNTYNFPLQIKSEIKNNKLIVSFKALFPLIKTRITKKVQKINSQKIQVQIYTNSKLFSEDIYEL